MVTAKKHDFVFNMRSSGQLENDMMTTYGLAMDATALSERDQRLFAQINTENLVSEGHRFKFTIAQHHLMRFHEQAVSEANKLADHHEAISQAQKGKMYESFVSEFIEADLQLAGNHLLEILEAAKHVYRKELMTPLTVPPEPKIVYQYVDREVPAKSLLERIFGA